MTQRKPYFYWACGPDGSKQSSSWVHANEKCALVARLEGWTLIRCSDAHRRMCCDSRTVSCFACNRASQQEEGENHE